jgi:hypothetical protein
VFKKDEDNQWTSPPLPAGSYEVFYNPCISTGFGVVGSLTANIVDHDINAGKLVLPLNVSISGHMQNTNAPSVTFDKVQVRLRPLDLRAASASMVPVGVRGDTPVASDGTFSFKMNSTFSTTSPGLYQIDVAGIPEDVYVASIKLGAREVRDSGFQVDADTPGPLEISLSQHGGVVDGVVKDRFGKPAADSMVALMPSNRDFVYSNLFRETRTAQDGAFTIRGIPPGGYEVIAVDDLDVGESRNAEFRDVFQSRILKISIKQDSLETVSLTAAPR